MIPVARFLNFLYFTTIVAAFCANMIVVSQTTTLSVLGAGLALRGPDGSMMTATDGIYEERKSVFHCFAIGLAATVGNVIVCVWLMLHWEAALCSMIIVLITCRTIWTNYKRVERRFAFNECDTVDFQDIMDGPANIQAVPSERRRRSPHNHHNGIGKHLKHENSFSSMEEDSDEWSSSWHQSQQGGKNIDRDMKQRRGRSPKSIRAIQTV